MTDTSISVVTVLCIACSMLLTGCGLAPNPQTTHEIPYPYHGSGIIDCTFDGDDYYFDAKDRFTKITVWGNGDQTLWFVNLQTHSLGASLRLKLWGGSPNPLLRCRELSPNEGVPTPYDY